MLKLEGSFFPYPSIFLDGNKIVASSVRFEDEKGSVINFSTSEEKNCFLVELGYVPHLIDEIFNFNLASGDCFNITFKGF